MNGQLSMGATRRLNRHYQSQKKIDFDVELTPHRIDVWGISTYEFDINFSPVGDVPKNFKFKSCSIEITGFPEGFYLDRTGFGLFGGVGGVSTIDCYSGNTGGISNATPCFSLNNHNIKNYDLSTIYIPIGTYQNYPVFEANHKETIEFDNTYKLVNGSGGFWVSYLNGYKYGGVNFNPNELANVKVHIILK